MGISGISNNNVTANGTKIVSSTDTGIDKNSFLKILTSELANQDPENSSDPTQYVAQLAQFTTLEQMSNLNSSVDMLGASMLIGKNVTLNSLDSMGNQYSGLVKSIVKNGSNVNLEVEVMDNGASTTQQFAYSDVVGVSNT